MVEIEIPDDATIDRMAQMIHEHYRSDQKNKETSKHPAMKQWTDLPVELQAQNRDQARDNIVKLAGIGLRVAPAGPGQANDVGLSDDQIEELARGEHDRWMTQKRNQGYRYGPERVDKGPDLQKPNKDLRHPDIKAWEDLGEEVRDKDREPVSRMIDVLASVGLMVVPADD